MEMDSSRRLALRLHALHDSDRDWILSRLDSEARTRLEPLLQELDSLGFDIDQEMVDAVAGRLDCPGSAPEAVDEHRQHVELLDRADPGWIAAQLKGEPRALLDCLAAIHPWAWLAAVRAADHLDDSPTRRDELRPHPTERVQRALLGQLARRMSVDCPESDRPAPLSTWRPPAPEAAARTARGLLKWLPWKR